MSAKSEDGNGVETECQNCGYIWTYTGTMWNATCPNCGRKTPTPHAEADPDSNDGEES